MNDGGLNGQGLSGIDAALCVVERNIESAAQLLKSRPQRWKSLLACCITWQEARQRINEILITQKITN